MNDPFDTQDEAMQGRPVITFVIHQPIVNITNGVLYMTEMAKRAMSMLPQFVAASPAEPIAQDSIALQAVDVMGYIADGLLTQEMKPAPGLSRGERAMLAHDIGERLQIPNFWSFFEQFWETNNMSTDYHKFRRTQKSIVFQKRLMAIK